MGKRKSIKENLKIFKENLNKNIPITKMYFFGSRVSGISNKDSDIDLIIVSPNFKKLDFFKRGAKMYDYWNLRYPVDFICYTPKEFNKLKKQPTIVKEAIETGIEI